jgi:hypothetical protein
VGTNHRGRAPGTLAARRPGLVGKRHVAAARERDAGVSSNPRVARRMRDAMSHRLGDAKGNQQRRGRPWYYGEAEGVEVRLKRGTREMLIEDTSPGAGHHVRAIERRWNRVVDQSNCTRTDGRTVGSPGTLASVLRFSFVPMPS